MAENTNNTNSSAPGGLYFIVGGLVVAVGIGAFLIYGPSGDGSFTKTTTEQTTTAPAAAPAEGTTTTTTTKETQQP